MTRDFKIKINNLSPSERLLRAVFILTMFSILLIDSFQFPSIIKYFIDMGLALLTLLNFRKLCNFCGSKAIYVWIIAFFIYSILGYMANYQSIIYYLWGLRNNFRFYLFFLLCIVILKKKDIPHFYRFLDILLLVNIFVCTIQYFALGFKRDYLGGVFGTFQGCNGYINLFMVIVLTKSVIYYINKKEPMYKCIYTIGATVYIAALAELKFYFAELIIVVAIAILITSFSWRKVIVIMGSLIALVVGINCLVLIFPEWSSTFSIKGFFEVGASEAGYTGSGDLNRLTAIPTIAERYLVTPGKFLGGYGLGNCDYGSSDLVTTPFYNSYGWLHYTWLSSAFVFFEMGAIGLLFFFGFFLLVFILIRDKMRRCNSYTEPAQIAQVMAVICVVIGIYNSSLRTEAGFMAYFILSLPFLSDA